MGRAEESYALAKVTERTQGQREVASQAIRNQREKDIALRRIELEKEELFDNRLDGERNKLMKGSRLTLAQLIQQKQMETELHASAKNASENVKLAKKAVKIAKENLEVMKKETARASYYANEAFKKASLAAKNALRMTLQSTSDPAKAKAKLDNATEAEATAKDEAQRIDEEGKLNVSSAEEHLKVLEEKQVATEAWEAPLVGNAKATRDEFQKGAKQTMRQRNVGDGDFVIK